MLNPGPDTKAVVLGLGSSGLATVRFLRRLGASVVVSEFRSEEELGQEDLALLDRLGVELESGGHTEKCIEDADLVVPSPGVPLDLDVLAFARERGIPVVGELALASGRLKMPVIAVTGSNGKTTVTGLIGTLLETGGMHPFVGGNIGRPLLDIFFLSPEEDKQAKEAEEKKEQEKNQVAVLELSSFQLELSGDFRPNIGILLNLSPDHLDRHGTMERYAAAKARLFASQRAGDTAILCIDDPLVMETQVVADVSVLGFGEKESAQARVIPDGVRLHGVIHGQMVDETYPLAGTRLSSRINRFNAAAAILAARVAGCPPSAIAAGLQRFTPPAHRMAEVALVGGVRFIDDSKATNTGAVIAALESCDSPVVLICGGRSKENDFRVLRESVAARVKHLVLIGEATEALEEALGDLVPAVRAGSMEEAVRKAWTLAGTGGTVLLSPACASFDMFAGYGQRGEVFENAVWSLQSEKKKEESEGDPGDG
ncbi:UDP-N-acetylmuramoyl-L-alanine--D-glutamate ligase [Desulfolithobacter sp.]